MIKHKGFVLEREGQVKERKGADYERGGADYERGSESAQKRKEGRERRGKREGRGEEGDGTLHPLIKLTNEHSQKTQHSAIVEQERVNHSSRTSDYGHKGVAQSRLSII